MQSRTLLFSAFLAWEWNLLQHWSATCCMSPKAGHATLFLKVRNLNTWQSKCWPTDIFQQLNQSPEGYGHKCFETVEDILNICEFARTARDQCICAYCMMRYLCVCGCTCGCLFLSINEIFALDRHLLDLPWFLLFLIKMVVASRLC